MRHAKAYSSSCSQTVSLSPAISLQFILRVCAADEDCKNQQKPLILEVQGLSVIGNNTAKKLVTNACCDRQHAHAFLKPFSQKTDQQR